MVELFLYLTGGAIDILALATIAFGKIADMIISFDLDDTLIPGSRIFETEDRNIIQRIAGAEKIRKGTIELFKNLRNRGHKIYIYTTSFRPAINIRITFLLYGLRVDRIINQQRHDKELKENKNRCSKFPPAFDIDIHVDDSPGLKVEGEKFNFKTVIIEENEANWESKILEIA